MTQHRKVSLRQSAATWEALFRSQVAVMRRLQAGQEFADISLREYDVLFNVSRCPGGKTRLNSLNEVLLISQPSLSRMIDRLQARGLVERHTAPDDQRGVLVSLTEAGREAQQRIGKEHVRHIHELLGSTLSEAEMLELQRITEKLRANLPDKPRHR